ncbi:MAG: hypothetical protein AAF378_25350, partial [Cyanobacteria bacterium P01_A01_bin.84]
KFTANNIQNKHPSANYRQLGRNGYVAFSGNNSQFSSSIVSATKAAIEQHRQAQEHKEAYSENSFDAVFYSPIVILNRSLYTANLDKKEQIKLQKSNHVTYRFNYMSPQYEEKSYLADIVTLDGLSAYIDKQDTWIESMFQFLKSIYCNV